MAFRIYIQTYKRWLIGIGVSLGCIGLGIFAYLAYIGAIVITANSGDMTCAGTIEDPCYAYINFTAKEDIYIYPLDYDPWGRDFIVQFEPEIKDWKLQRSWGSSWRTINLSKTWNKNTKYAIKFAKGQDYQVRVVGYKHNPSDNIKWAVNYGDREYLDPAWNATSNLTIYLNNEAKNQHYEYETTANISAISDCDGCIVCIDFYAPEFKANQSCGNRTTEFNYTVGNLIQRTMNDSLTEIRFNFTNKTESKSTFRYFIISNNDSVDHPGLDSNGGWMTYNFTGLTLAQNSCNETRLTNEEDNEVPYQLLSSGANLPQGARSCYLGFLANTEAGVEEQWDISYNDTSTSLTTGTTYRIYIDTFDTGNATNWTWSSAGGSPASELYPGNEPFVIGNRSRQMFGGGVVVLSYYHLKVGRKFKSTFKVLGKENGCLNDGTGVLFGIVNASSDAQTNDVICRYKEVACNVQCSVNKGDTYTNVTNDAVLLPDQFTMIEFRTNDSRSWNFTVNHTESLHIDDVGHNEVEGLFMGGIGSTLFWNVTYDEVAIWNYSVYHYAVEDTIRLDTINGNVVGSNRTDTFTVYINLSSYEHVKTEINLTGNKHINRFPTNLTIDVLNNGTLDFILPSWQILNKTTIQQDRLSGLKTGDLIYPTPGSQRLFLNYSANSLDLLLPFNITFDIHGGPSMAENLSFTDKFHNSSYINLLNSTVQNIWTWEDFSIGDVASRWTGSYTIDIGDFIQTEASTGITGSADCLDSPSSASDTSDFQSLTINITRGGSVLVNISSTATADCGFQPCNNPSSSTGSAGIYLKDETIGSNILLVEEVGASSYCVGGASPDSSSDIVNKIYEFRVFESLSKIDFYKDSVFQSSIAYDPTHQYELYSFTAATATAQYNQPVGSAGRIKIYEINRTGITGERTGNFTWINSTIMSTEIKQFTTNLSVALLESDTVIPSGTTISFYLSADNATTWEGVQPGIGHTFNTTGQTLRWKAELSTKGGQDDGSLSTIPIIYRLDLEVSSGFPTNISVDLGYDGIVDWNMTGELTNTTSETVTLDKNLVNEYISLNCQGELLCEIPLSIHTDSAGIIGYGNVSANTNLSGIDLNPDVISNFLSNCTGICQIPINISTGSGSLLLDGINFQYIGDGTLPVFAHVQEDYSVNQTSYIFVRYSPFNVSFPYDVDGFFLQPRSLTQTNITPFGQEVNYCNENNKSVGLCEKEYNYCDIIGNRTLSCWNFDTNDSNDYIGSNDGTVVGATWNSSGGIIGSAFLFDGDGDYIITPIIHFDTSSYSIWFKPNVLPIINQDILQMGGNSLRFRKTETTQYRMSLRNSSSTIEKVMNFGDLDNEWHNFVGVIDFENENMSGYLDGVLFDSIHISGGLKSHLNLYFGSAAGTSQYFNGTIDQVQIWNRTLNPSEVSRLYEETKNKFIIQDISIPIFNITNNAKVDPITIHLKLNETFSCVNITADEDINRTGSHSLNETHKQIISNISLNSDEGIWSWTDLNNCSYSELQYFSPYFDFDSLCASCFETDDAFRN